MYPGDDERIAANYTEAKVDVDSDEGSKAIEERKEVDLYGQEGTSVWSYGSYYGLESGPIRGSMPLPDASVNAGGQHVALVPLPEDKSTGKRAIGRTRARRMKELIPDRDALSEPIVELFLEVRQREPGV
ncbi:uncharacterized protein ARMOST_15233 [Armillaria ostoyae]|uniref:Uncharacterized protein n=1 Tax=Armillaria ostoyae TaxID=47428 RepID=A0A284RSU1_ARMOS|nr:uncharacterized protein ARMOST_15233 [Armillaria ostoyae]